MSGNDAYRMILIKFLKLSLNATDQEITAAAEARCTPLAIRLAGLEAEADELERAAKIAAQNGMYESGATLHNRAAGIRRAIEVINRPTP